ncbi:MAG: substrate-binding domain-containing protein, partial [Hyphomicrobiales bacterium]|nr:substrate-binding domain-containing protein [Hyphomicrobiales bacterium]
MSSDLAGISSMATRQILAELAASFERQSGWRVAITSIGGVEAARRVRAGDPIDIVVLAANVMEELEGSGYLIAGSRAGFARSSIAIAVRAGEEPARIDGAEALKQAVLKARKIAYSTGPSGDHLKRLFALWGIADAISARLVQAQPGIPVGSLLAKREADLGFQQLSKLLHLPGIDIIGLLPPEIQNETVFSAAIASRSSKPDQARALIEFLASPDTAATKRRHGLEP